MPFDDLSTQPSFFQNLCEKIFLNGVRFLKIYLFIYLGVRDFASVIREI